VFFISSPLLVCVMLICGPSELADDRTDDGGVPRGDAGGLRAGVSAEGIDERWV
jgi:hypothetical protein